MRIVDKERRLGKEQYNNQGCLMRIVVYNHCRDIIVEFQDSYKGRVHTNYNYFLSGKVRNPYFPDVLGVGITGNKYKVKVGGKLIKEYIAWKSMLKRCFDFKYKNNKHTYQHVFCCEDWILFENFYNWLHLQPNFDKWLSGELWAVEKDILLKGNKAYSPDTCCLVPMNVNSLFLKGDAMRGNLPIGVTKTKYGYQAKCRNPFIKGKVESLGTYNTPEQAFLAYKKAKESYIKQVAEIEYSNDNITKQCYEAMINYEVEIND